MSEMKMSPGDVKAPNLLMASKGNEKNAIFSFPENWLSWQVKERSPYSCSLVDLHSWLSLSVILNQPSTGWKGV